MLAKWFGLEGKVALVVGASRGLGREMTLEDWYRTVDTNLTGAFLVCREAGRVMKEKGGFPQTGPGKIQKPKLVETVIQMEERK